MTWLRADGRGGVGVSSSGRFGAGARKRSSLVAVSEAGAVASYDTVAVVAVGSSRSLRAITSASSVAYTRGTQHCNASAEE